MIKFVSILLMMIWLGSYGQSIKFVSNFEVVEVADGIFVNWEIDSGYTCQGIDILRSTDQLNYEEIGHISGVCGSLSKPVSYSHLDERPVGNSINFYKLKINGYGFTEVLSLHYLTVPKSGVLIYPNPVNGQDVYLKFDNANQNEVVVEIYDLNGRLVTVKATQDREMVISSTFLEKGVYTLRLISTREGSIRTAKLIVN